MNARIVVALAAGLSVNGAARTQELAPSPSPSKPCERLVVELRALPHERPLLLMAPHRIAPMTLPAVDGQLMLDPNGLALVADGVTDEQGITRFVLPLLHGIDASLHAQALVVDATGFRLSPPFVVQASRVAPARLFPATVPALPVRGRLPFVDDRTATKPEQASIAILHDAKRAETRLLVSLVPKDREPPLQLEPGRRVGSDPEIVEAAVDSSSMSELSAISAADSEQFPYRVNCKLWMSFPTGTFGGSGMLIDPYHVMTAAHCVCDPDEGGWASQIIVAPGYDDDRADPTPFGTANWVHGIQSYLMWSGWTSSQDWDDDICIIELDRPIGALTSWFGYGASSSCDFYKGTTFWARSYPIEGHTGADMYDRSGSFDTCPNDFQARFYRYGYGGESGSGYYFISGDSRYVMGVASHQSWTLWNGDVTDVVHLTAAKFTSVQSLLTSARSSTTDLIPLVSGVSASSVRRGNTVDVTFRVLNYGRTSFTPSWSYSIRLSSNTNITTSDPELASGLTTADIGSMDVSERTRTVTIPSGSSTGTWYLGVILTATDAVTGNNTTASTDVKAVSVTS
jgi:V8-like Glu-specific endopeptidase